eukprot:2434666-Rhodomonas_salina.1
MAHPCKRIRIEGHAGTLAEQPEERQVDERLNAPLADELMCSFAIVNALRGQNAKERKDIGIVNAAKKQADDIQEPYLERLSGLGLWKGLGPCSDRAPENCWSLQNQNRR